MLDDATVCIEFSLRPTHSQQPCTARQAGNRRRNLATLRYPRGLGATSRQRLLQPFLRCHPQWIHHVLYRSHGVKTTDQCQKQRSTSNVATNDYQCSTTTRQPTKQQSGKQRTMLQLTMSSQHQCRSSNAPTESRSNAMGSRQGPPEQRSATSPLAGSTETNRDVTQPGRISMSKCQQLFNTHSCHHS